MYMCIYQLYLFDKELQFPRCIGERRGGGGWGGKKVGNVNVKFFFFFSICKKPLRLFLHYTNKLFTIQEVYYRDIYNIIFSSDTEINYYYFVSFLFLLFFLLYYLFCTFVAYWLIGLQYCIIQ